MAKRGLAITVPQGGGQAEELHSLRKRCKELRYLLEFFGTLYDPAAYRRAVGDLRGLQDVLGELNQDGEVQRDAIRGFAAEMLAAGTAASAGQPPAAELAATLLAMGELTAQLHARQDRARERVAGRFADFTRQAACARWTLRPRRPGHEGLRDVRHQGRGGEDSAGGRPRLPVGRRAGYRTLLWDLDPQGAATYVFRVRPRVKGGGKGNRPRRPAARRRDQGH